MNMSMKLRKFGNWLRWPFVTRARFELNQQNYEAEITYYQVRIDELRKALKAARDPSNLEYAEQRAKVSGLDYGGALGIE